MGPKEESIEFLEEIEGRIDQFIPSIDEYSGDLADEFSDIVFDIRYFIKKLKGAY